MLGQLTASYEDHQAVSHVIVLLALAKKNLLSIRPVLPVRSPIWPAEEDGRDLTQAQYEAAQDVLQAVLAELPSSAEGPRMERGGDGGHAAAGRDAGSSASAAGAGRAARRTRDAEMVARWSGGHWRVDDVIVSPGDRLQLWDAVTCEWKSVEAVEVDREAGITARFENDGRVVMAWPGCMFRWWLNSQGRPLAAIAGYSAREERSETEGGMQKGGPRREA